MARQTDHLLTMTTRDKLHGGIRLKDQTPDVASFTTSGRRGSGSSGLGRLGSNDDTSNTSATLSYFLKNNPVSKRLRKRELKIQRKKDEAVLASIRRTAELQKPKPMSQENKDRVQELKSQKENKIKRRNIAVSDTPSTWTAALHQHKRETRLSLVTGLLLVLALLLGDPKVLSYLYYDSKGSKWSDVILRDVTALVFFGVCGIIHFMLCYVKLVYAFDAFEFFRKTGEDLKTFYRNQVQRGVALFSGAIVGLCVMKAVAYAWIKTLMMVAVRYAAHLSTVDEQDLEEYKATVARNFVIRWSAAIVKAIHIVYDKWYTDTAANMCYPDGVVLERPLGAALHDPISWEEVKESLESWREDALLTIRYYLGGTGFWLVVILVLFTPLTRSFTHGTPHAVAGHGPQVARRLGSGQSDSLVSFSDGDSESN